MSLCWRLAILAFVACGSVLGDDPQPPSPPPRKTLGQEIGSPSELAWQAWLLVENKGGPQQPQLDSSNILRRITPKSIFIAPELISCPSGYSSDGRGTCKPDPINIDEAAQRQFFLKRLNALYGKLGNGRKKPEQQAQQQQQPPQATGPLQINIPISIPGKAIEGKVDEVVIAQNKSQDAVTVVVYEVANETKTKSKEESSFLLGTSNAPKQSNETFDYKVTSSNKSSQPSEKKLDDETSPTLVLLLSPTKLPYVITSTTTTTEKSTDTTKLEDEETSIYQVENTSILPTTVTLQDIKLEADTTIQTVAPLDVQTENDEVAESTIGTTTEKPFYTVTEESTRQTDQQMFTTTTSVTPSQDDETAYTDDDEVTAQDSTEDVDQEYTDDPTESTNDEETEEEGEEDEFDGEDELLKPGEAGMMIVRTKTTVTEPITTTLQETTTETTIPTEIITTTMTTEKLDLKETIVTEPEVILSTQQGNYGRKTILPPSEPIFLKNEGDIPSEFKDQVSFDTKPTFIRFPEPSSNKNTRGYIRFPSDEVNSIYSNQDTFKPSPTTTKSYRHWRIPASSPRTQQKPMLLRFWARMPLVRDLSFYPTTSHGSHNEPIGGARPNRAFLPVTPPIPARRVINNYYKELSSHDVDRLLAQQYND